MCRISSAIVQAAPFVTSTCTSFLIFFVGGAQVVPWLEFANNFRCEHPHHRDAEFFLQLDSISLSSVEFKNFDMKIIINDIITPCVPIQRDRALSRTANDGCELF